MAQQRGLVLDANILIRLCLGSRVRNLVLDHVADVAFFAPDVCFGDARRYLPSILQRRSVDPEPVSASGGLRSDRSGRRRGRLRRRETRSAQSNQLSGL